MIDEAAIRRALDVIGRDIVDPRCDECTAGLLPSPHEAGLPRLCSACERRLELETAARTRDWVSQERPRGRTVHVVRLPPGGLK